MFVNYVFDQFTPVLLWSCDVFANYVNDQFTSVLLGMVGSCSFFFWAYF